MIALTGWQVYNSSIKKPPKRIHFGGFPLAPNICKDSAHGKNKKPNEASIHELLQKFVESKAT
jgi:hypothetical protein